LDGGYQATRTLIEGGTKRIAVIACGLLNVMRRVEGYRKALNEAGMPLRDEYICIVEEGMEAAIEATRQLMSLEEPPDGIFYYNDYSAVAGIRALRDLGVTVPGQVRVVGFDDIALASEVMPSLTTVRQDHDRIGAEAGRMMVEALNAGDEPRLGSRSVLVPTEIVLRESTGEADR
jgi:DNA-binding LacI/PurR family transcriptional regulator